jgi:probable HAF family extracellular repeat protein
MPLPWLFANPPAPSQAQGLRIASRAATSTIRESRTYAVNALGTAVGNSPVSNGNSRAAMWRDGKIIDLTPDVAVYEPSWASSVNDGGKWARAA